jgi:hypothetical protein
MISGNSSKGSLNALGCVNRIDPSSILRNPMILTYLYKIGEADELALSTIGSLCLLASLMQK